ncbi:MAG: amidohydrolase family protein [Actinomycetia bacterium]|nr:amidohydrolase family protein [Actinomycetes bacterium]MCP4086342.1 amidohydrolase family protein [Actinomycetes bacterium]
MDRVRVFTAAQIRTMDPGRPTASAVAVADGRIVSVGSLESMDPWLRRVDHDIDDTYAQQVLMPGLIDPHTHLRMSGTYMGLEYVGPIPCQGPAGVVQGLDDRDAALARLSELVAASDDPSRPIITWGYDPGTQAGHLDRDMLDQISDTVPIWVLSYAPHIVYTNTPMIELIGVTEDTVAHGLGRYPDGRLNGWFIETGAVGMATAPVRADVYRPGFGIEALERQGKVAVRNGITTTADMIWGFDSFEGEWDDHQQVIDGGGFPLRVLLVPFDSRLVRKFGDDRLEFLRTMSERSTDRLAAHGVKFVNDGSYPSMTLKLNFPGYLDGEEGLTGEVPWNEMVEAMWPYWDAGVQIHSHANGDETVDMTLDTLAALQLRKPRFDHRFTIEHYCISRVDQCRRLAALGAMASVNPYFVHYRSLLHSDSGFGPDRAEATARLGSLERAGAMFTLHSDYNLVVGPMAPLTAAWVAVNRLAADGETVMAPGERISVDRALRAITTDAAHVLRRDHEVGSLEVGKLADFVVLGDDPYEVDPAGLHRVPVVGTVLGGEPHEADG